LKRLGEELAAIYAATEPARHAAEVRHLIALRKKGVAHKERYLELVEQKRGREAADKLARDAAELWIRQKASK
jgi:hypothetical protein